MNKSRIKNNIKTAVNIKGYYSQYYIESKYED